MSPRSPLKIAVLALTHDKTEHATGLWKVIRTLWSRSPELQDCTLYHVFNGQESWYPKKTGEDVLIRRENLGHIEGVLDMLNTGIHKILDSNIPYDFIIVCSSDAWITKPSILAQTLQDMKTDQQHLLASLWFSPSLWGSEWFAITPRLAHATFPLVSAPSSHRLLFQQIGSVIHKRFPLFQAPLLEDTLTNSLKKGLQQEHLPLQTAVKLLPHRQFVWLHNRYRSPQIGYDSDHDLEKKQRFFTL